MSQEHSPATGDSSAPVRPTLSDMRNFLEQMQEYGHGLDEWHLTREAMERVLKLAIKAEEAAIVMRLSDLSKRCAPSEIVDNCCPLCGPASAPSATPRIAAEDMKSAAQFLRIAAGREQDQTGRWLSHQQKQVDLAIKLEAAYAE